MYASDIYAQTYTAADAELSISRFWPVINCVFHGGNVYEQKPTDAIIDLHFYSV